MCRVGAPWGHWGLCESSRLLTPGFIPHWPPPHPRPPALPPLPHVLDVTRNFPPPAGSFLCLPDLRPEGTSLVEGTQVWPGDLTLSQGWAPGRGPPRCAGTLCHCSSGHTPVSPVLPGKPLLDKPSWIITLTASREALPDPTRAPDRPGSSGISFFPYCLPATLGLVQGRAWVLSGGIE